ncbi:MAG: phosphoglycerate dehydrogenase [Chloroflexi bacterium]|nr:phosphoglycerate dehydrogenase [Chloroflexota bacterium]
MGKRILVADPVAEEGIDVLKPHAEVDVKTGLKPEELLSIIGEYDGLVVRSETKVTEKVIEAGKRLQVIGRAGVGVDNIDVESATRRGIVVVYAPTGNTISAAEHTIALMLSMARNIPQASALLKAGQWKRSEFTGVEVRNKTLGIIGLGRVGSEVARRAKGLDMKVIGFDPYVSPEHAQNIGVEIVSLEDLLKKSDFVAVHTPMTSATRGLIGRKELALVKPTTRFINCARGGIIDEEALYEAIEAGRVAGAAIDVFTKEPACDNILCKSDKVVVTPHLGASTEEAQTNVSIDVAEEILAVLQAKPVRYAVNMPLIAVETRSVLAPFLDVATQVGGLATQLAEGQVSTIVIRYEGEIANYDTAVLKAAVIGALLAPISEERVNLINASLIAASRGLKVTEQKGPAGENYANLITVEIGASKGTATVGGTHLRGEVHIVRVNEYWMDLMPTGGYWLFIDHRDRPGLIGSVGMVTGKADINISSMQVSRLKPRGQALMVLGLDEPVNNEQIEGILAIPDVYKAKVVKF